MQYLVILRYGFTFLSLMVIILIVYIIFPGNLIVAFISGLLVVITLLPLDKGSNGDSGNEKDRNALDETVRSVNQEELDEEKTGYLSMLGSVFDTMARNAARDLYSSEITGTEDQAQNHGEGN